MARACSWWGYFFLLLFSWPQISLAENLFFASNARTQDIEHHSLTVKALGYSCLAASPFEDSLACNPALGILNKKSSLKMFGLISNGYSNLSTVSKILDGDVDSQLVEKLLGDEKLLQSESQIDILMISSHFSARYSPISYRFFSVTRNEANPEAQLLALKEEELNIQTSFQNGSLYYGAELKAVSWTYIKEQFRLVDLATPTGRDQVKPQTQKAVFIQPGLAFQTDIAMKPMFSLKIVRLGQIDQTERSRIQTEPDYEFGVALNPEVPYGRLKLMLDYKDVDLDQEKSAHFGALYSYGVLNLASGVDSQGASAGVFYSLDQVSSGILYSTTQVPWRSDDYYAQTVYVQVGWQL